MVRVAGGNSLIALLQAARAPAVVVISAVYVDAEQIAFYVAAHRLANIMSLGLLGVSGFASPLVSGYFALKDFSKLQHLARLSARGSIVGAIATGLVLIVFGAGCCVFSATNSKSPMGPSWSSYAVRWLPRRQVRSAIS